MFSTTMVVIINKNGKSPRWAGDTHLASVSLLALIHYMEYFSTLKILCFLKQPVWGSIVLRSSFYFALKRRKNRSNFLPQPQPSNGGYGDRSPKYKHDLGQPFCFLRSWEEIKICSIVRNLGSKKCIPYS